MEATFTVSENSFGWQQTFTGMKQTFNRWQDLVAWCLAPGALHYRVQQAPGRHGSLYDVEPDVLAIIVDGYFRKYAPQAEWSGPEFQCTPGRLSGPPPSHLSKVRELLEAASSEQR